MFRSIMLVCAIGALGAVGCVAQDGTDEAAVAQQTGGGGSGSGALFNCQNNASISGVQCVSVPININVNNVGNGNLSGNYLTILNDDLNNLNIGDINILNGNSILSDLVDVSKNDFLNKFSVSTGAICAQASVLDILGITHLLQVCK